SAASPSPTWRPVRGASAGASSTCGPAATSTEWIGRSGEWIGVGGSKLAGPATPRILMEIAPPVLVFYAIATVGGVVWLWGLTYLLASARLGRADAPAAERFAAEEDRPARDLLTGAAEV